MPSTRDPDQLDIGAGKLHSNVATAAADYQMSSGTSSLLAAALAAINQELAVPAVTATLVSAGEANKAISGIVWTGDNGADPVTMLFQLVDDDDNEVRNGGVTYSIIGITGPSIGDGFVATGATVTFSAALPVGLNYKIRYMTRVTLASLPVEAVGVPLTRSSARLTATTKALLETLHAGAAAQEWDDAWTTTVLDLAKSGLDERYRRATSAAGNLDTAGDGAVIFRDGQAPAVQAEAVDFDYLNPSSDRFLANFLSQAGPEILDQTSDRRKRDGGTGFVASLSQRLSFDTQERTSAAAYSLASRIDVVERAITSSVFAAANVRTRVDPSNSTGTALNPEALATTVARQTIRIGTTDHLWSSVSPNLSEIALGRDLLEVTYPGGERQIFVITQLFGGNYASSPVPGEDSRRALLRTLQGTPADFPASVTTTGVKFRLIKIKYFQGCGTAKYMSVLDGGHADPVFLGHFYHAITPPITDDVGILPGIEDAGDAEFFARGRSVQDVVGGTAPLYALRWGGHDAQNWVQQITGGLRGDGTVEATTYKTKVHTETVSASGAKVINWHPIRDGAILSINLTHATGVVALTINVDADYFTDYVGAGMITGDEIEIHISNSSAAPTPGIAAVTTEAVYTISWHGIFSFEGNGGVPVTYNISGDNTVNKWKGTFSSASNDFIMHDEVFLGAGD